MSDSNSEIRCITTSQTYQLRQEVLRPGRPVSTAQFADDERATHFGCFVDDALIGIVTIFPQPFDEDQTAWQLRGMAVAATHQKRGYGEALIQACCEYAREQGAKIIWCYARQEAASFYRKQGFIIHGAEFIIPDVGPHYVMWRSL